MTNVSKSVILAVDVFVMCIVLTMCFFTYRAYKKTSQVAAQNMNSTTAEYADAAISEMLGNTYTGAEVKNYIKKYRRDMKVEVRTLQKPSGTVYSASIVYTAVNADNPEFIGNSDVFMCSASKDTNGIYARIVFEQAGTLSGITVTTPEEAQFALSQKLGLPADVSWQTIIDTVNFRDEDGAKQLLINSLGGSYNTGSSWDAIAEETVKRLSRYQALLDASNNASGHNSSGKVSIAYSQSYSLDFTPNVIVVQLSSDSGKAYTWMHGIWVGENPGMKVQSSGSGVVLTHENSIKQSVKMIFEAYN